MIQRKEILETLMTINDVNELKLIRSAIRDRIDEVSSRVKYELTKGDRVIITTKNGIEEGVVEKINRTRAVVDIDDKGFYNVPFSMITKNKENV
tara:strand:+ start:820 stop:1101 length:282 start_codon:yes stop_codon:yes gene_type:complete